MGDTWEMFGGLKRMRRSDMVLAATLGVVSGWGLWKPLLDNAEQKVKQEGGEANTHEIPKTSSSK